MLRTLTILILYFLLMACSGLQPSNPPRPIRQIAEPNNPENHYLTLIQNHPQDPEPWFQLGNLYAESNRLEAAEYSYRQALKRGAHPKATHNLGLVQIRLGVAALNQARSDLPKDPSTQQQTRKLLKALLEVQ